MRSRDACWSAMRVGEFASGRGSELLQHLDRLKRALPTGALFQNRSSIRRREGLGSAIRPVASPCLHFLFHPSQHLVSVSWRWRDEAAESLCKLCHCAHHRCQQRRDELHIRTAHPIRRSKCALPVPTLSPRVASLDSSSFAFPSSPSSFSPFSIFLFSTINIISISNNTITTALPLFPSFQMKRTALCLHTSEPKLLPHLPQPLPPIHRPKLPDDALSLFLADHAPSNRQRRPELSQPPLHRARLPAEAVPPLP
mmetsp:Transcript_31845/g.75031  ORF Transcript_31845/g.75031 Transcript_31845/m.75031 type:complete len:255 (+) Transcript_31845:449-1213(+)